MGMDQRIYHGGTGSDELTFTLLWEAHGHRLQMAVLEATGPSPNGSMTPLGKFEWELVIKELEAERDAEDRMYPPAGVLETSSVMQEYVEDIRSLIDLLDEDDVLWFEWDN